MIVGVIALENEYGETIVVKRGPGGRVLVSHSDITPEGQFGLFIDAPTIHYLKDQDGKPIQVTFEPDGHVLVREVDGLTVLSEAYLLLQGQG